ncbi:MAG: pyridoxal phosphate-dependent aminotransferase [Clostridiales bacterium]|nr:pyridoxal phosphate-dependent aminotransferase [Clostridiales bacterium]
MNFDILVNRKNTDCIKWDGLKEIYGKDDILPLWIADMDFESSPEIIDALINRSEHGVFGYPLISAKIFEPFIEWNKRRNGLNIDQEWILTCPGLVTGFTLGILAFTKEGDGVMIQTPVYPPFHSSVKNNNRILIENQLIEKEGYYTIDFEDFERKIRENNVKLFILCNPHNPVGRVWTLEELERMAEICLKYDVKIFSDEIHSDLILKGYKFKSILSLDEKYKKIIISAMAPSKTFNIAGLTASMVLIPDEDTRETYDKVRQSLSIGMLNIFGLTALEAAYRHGEQWLEEVMSYIEDNFDYMISFIKEEMPHVKCRKPEATYLGWLDFRNIYPKQDDLNDFLINKAKVALNSGLTFGKQGEGFVRINLGCPRSILEEALNRIRTAL